MTTIVGIENSFKTLIASDSQVSRGFERSKGAVKIVQNGDYTFAAAGYARSIQILRYANLPPIPDAKGDLTVYEHSVLDRFFTNEIIPSIRQAFEDVRDKDKLDYTILLVALRNRLYEVNGACGAWSRSETGLYGFGSGGAYALGALKAGADVDRAVRIAAEYDLGTDSDVRVVTIEAK